MHALLAVALPVSMAIYCITRAGGEADATPKGITVASPAERWRSDGIWLKLFPPRACLSLGVCDIGQHKGGETLKRMKSVAAPPAVVPVCMPGRLGGQVLCPTATWMMRTIRYIA